MKLDPIAFKATRYKCPHCGKSWSSRSSAVQHMARCARDPDNRGCMTCAHDRSWGVPHTWVDSDGAVREGFKLERGCAACERPSDVMVKAHCQAWASKYGDADQGVIGTMRHGGANSAEEVRGKKAGWVRLVVNNEVPK